MNKLLSIILLSFFAFNANAQQTTTVEHPAASFLAKRNIKNQTLLIVKPESKKQLLKEIGTTPRIEVYNKMGGKLDYPSPEGHLIKSFFDPNDKTSIPMTSATPATTVSNETILKRFINCVMPDGSKIPSELIQSPDKYYVTLIWKSSTKKRNLEILKNWTEYANANKQLKLLLINVD